MKFDAAAFLAQHKDDPIAALNALEAMREEAQTGRDKEGQAAATARKQRDDAKSELAAAQDQLAEAKKTAVPEGAVVLTGEDATVWQSITEKGGRDYLTARLTRAEEADGLESKNLKIQASLALGRSQEHLDEWLGGRGPLTVQTEKKDGKEVPVYGITVKEDGKDVFKPLDSFATFNALPKSGAQDTTSWPTGSKPAGSESSKPDDNDPIGASLRGAPDAAKTTVVSAFAPAPTPGS